MSVGMTALVDVEGKSKRNVLIFMKFFEKNGQIG